jgi:hypothetical protein
VEALESAKQPTSLGQTNVGLTERKGVSDYIDFRHGLPTFFINKGKDVKTIQGLLRHAKASATLDLYSRQLTPLNWRPGEILPAQS